MSVSIKIQKEDLLEPDEMPEITGYNVPQQFYWILKHPNHTLAGMSYPHEPNKGIWDSLHQNKFDYVINLAENECGYDPSPLRLLYVSKLEDLIHGDPPKSPEKESGLINEAVRHAVNKFDEGKGVVIHCVGGTGRTGTVLGCILKVLGVESNDVINYLDNLNRNRNKPGWPESEWQANEVRCFSGKDD